MSTSQWTARPIGGSSDLAPLDAARAALRPAPKEWAVGPAVGVMLAAALVAVGGAVSHQWHAVSLIYLGVTFSAVYTKWGTYRLRLATLLGQAVGATAGLWLGSVPHTDPARVAVAVAVGVAAGLLGGLRPSSTAAGNMAVIGVAFAEFGQVERSPTVEVGCYLLGAAAIGIVALSSRPSRYGRTSRNPTPIRSTDARRAEAATDLIPLPTRARSISGWSWRSATVRGLRLGWCIGIATAVTAVLHQHNHSYWIPLTVAVLIRHDATIPVRTINRLAGTLVGTLVAVSILLAVPNDKWVIAAAAAVALGFAVAAAPRLYALTVAGMTCSTLLSACIASVDPAYPTLRLADTLIGAAVAAVFGYLLWPRRAPGELPKSAATARPA